MKLYKVTAVVETYICSEIIPNKLIAALAIKDEVEDNATQIRTIVEQIVGSIQLPPCWLNSIPWGEGNDEDLTCEQIANGEANAE